MGLFGGFRAKLKGNNPKTKKEQQTNIVCTKYTVHSEFDNIEASSSSSRYHIITKNLDKNTITNKPENVIKQAVKNGGDKQNETINIASVIVEKKDTIENVIQDNNVIFETIKQKKSITSQESEIKYETIDEPKSEPIDNHSLSITNEKIESTPFNVGDNSSAASTAVIGDVDENIYEEFLSGPNNNPDDFEVHVMHHNVDDIHSITSEETERESDHENVDNNNYRISFPQSPGLEFSSEAENIFFGSGEEPEVIRPRPLNIDDDNESHGSSASA